MRVRSLWLVALLAFASSTFAKDVWLTIGGSVGNFRTDTRIFNPSNSKDITVRAILFPAGSPSGHPENPPSIEWNARTRTITIPRRAMVAYDDILTSLFQSSGLAAILLTTEEDEFEATQRIYAAEATGTLGQFVPGLDLRQSMRKGVILQLKSTGTSGTRGTFRSNIGFVYPVNNIGILTLRLYGKNNVQVGPTKTIELKPFGVVAPTNITSIFDVGTADLSDAYVAFQCADSVYAYGSVLDNGSQDPTYVPASPDAGSPLEVGQPATEKILDMTMRNWSIDVAPVSLKVGDKVKLLLRSTSGTHGFQMFDPVGNAIVTASSVLENAADRTFSFTVTHAGEYGYFCTTSTCGVGHNEMTGTLIVGQ